MRSTTQLIIVSEGDDARAAFANESIMLKWAEEHGYGMGEDGSFTLVPMPYSGNTGDLTLSYGCALYQ